MASVPAIERGLHTVRYVVMSPEDGTVLAMAGDRGAVLAAARQRLAAVGWQPEAANDEIYPRQGELWPDIDTPPLVPAPRYVSRRRRRIFEQSDGRCIYCSEQLELDGAWHIEHQLPRALGGDDKPLNLVAACARCNLEKRDRTALEYLTSKSGAQITSIMGAVHGNE